MLKTLEDVSATKKRLKIEIPAEVIESEIQKGLRDAQRRGKFPGFRPGKAPLSMVEKKFGKEIETEVLERVIPAEYRKALEEARLVPVSQPAVEESPEFQRNLPLSMTVTVDVRPSVDSLSYEGIPVKEAAVEVKDEEVEMVLNNLAEERAAFESVTDAVQQADLVTLDYTARVAGQEEPTTAADVVVKVGSGPYPQEFFDALLGKQKDAVFAIEASFPEDSPTPFAGKRPKFELTIKDIKRRAPITLDDEFAKDLGLESLEQVKTRIRENLLAAKNRDADRGKQREILETLLETHRFEVPESLLRAEVEGMVAGLKASGKETRSDEELLAELHPQAEKSVRATLLLDMIGEKEGVTVSEDELKEEIVSIARRYYISPENVIKYYVKRDGSLEGLKHSVFEGKVLSLLLSKAAPHKGE